MSDLTKAQHSELERLCKLKMPVAYQRYGWPGFPERCVDMRLVPALVRKGYAEGGIHQYEIDGRLHGGQWWRATEAGHNAMETPHD